MQSETVVQVKHTLTLTQGEVLALVRELSTLTRYLDDDGTAWELLSELEHMKVRALDA
jgi:hypothetical protein